MAGNESFDLGLGRRERQPVTERLADIQRGAPLAGEPPKPKTIQDISVETGVPWNVIETVVGDSGVAPEQSLVLAEDFAHKMKQEIDAGRDIPSAMRSIFGDDAPIEDALERAVALAGRGDEGRASSGQNNDNSFAEDFGRSLAGGAITGVGMIAEGAGTLLDVDDLFGDPGITDWTEKAGRAVAGALQGWGQNVKDGMSDDAKRAIRNSTPKGKIFEPSTWEFEGDVSPKGIALLTADVLGSLAPVVIAGAFTGGVGGAVVGGLQGAGAGSQTGREIVKRATHEQLKANSAYYNDLLAKGMKPNAAKEKVADAAGSLAAVFAAPVAGAGGAFTGRLVQKGLPGLASKSLAPRVAGTAAVGAVEEGTQEVVEGVAARTGAEMASGLPVDQMEGTFGEFVLGALGGGAFGAGRGLLPSRQEDEGDDTETLALPKPDPQLPPPGGAGGNADPTARPPLGPLSRAALAAPGQPPAPEPTVTAQPGQSVRVTLAGGQTVDAEYVGEDEGGVSLKVNGEPVLISPDRMAMDGITIEPVDALAEASWDGIETTPETNFTPIDDTTEPPAKRAERLGGVLDTYLSEQQIEVTPEDRAEIANSIDRLGGTVEQAVADLLAERQIEALAQEAEQIAPVPQPGEGSPNPKGQMDASVSAWDRANRNRRNETWISGAAEANPAFEAVKDAGSSIPAHGMAKAATLTEATRNLISMLSGGIRPGLYYDALTAREAGAGAASGTSGGAAYRDGPFIITFKKGMKGDPTSDDVTGVLVNPENAELVEPLRAMFPNLSVETFANVAKHLNATTGETLGLSPTTPLAITSVDQITDGTAWGSMTPEQRQALLVNAGFKDAQGAINGPGKRAAAKPWNELSERVQQKLAEQIEPQAQTGAPVAPVADPNRGLAQGATPALEEPQERPTRTQPGVNVLPDGEEPIAMPGTRVASDGYPSIGATPEIDEGFADNRAALGQFKNGMRVQWTNPNFNPPRTFTGTITKIDRKSGQGTVEVRADGGVDGNGFDVSIGAARLSPEGEGAPGSVSQAANETEENPTEGQKEAENYKTGKADWMGLKLSVENRKGTERSKKTPDGKTEWSVTMPAHYGRILSTKGADGDHVDFYMGDNEASEKVWVIDQMDAETGRFDEHKVMLGFDDGMDAADIYEAGFSDGKGRDRLGGMREMTVPEFKEWLADGDTTKPVTPKAARDDEQAQSTQEGENNSLPPETPADPFTAKVQAALETPSVGHITKRGKKLRGHILRDVTKEEAQQVDKYTFKKDGGFFIREKDAAEYVGKSVPKRGLDHPEVVAEVKRLGDMFAGQNLENGRNPDLTLTTLPEPSVMAALNALAGREWSTPPGATNIRELRFNEVADARAFIAKMQAFDGTVPNDTAPKLSDGMRIPLKPGTAAADWTAAGIAPPTVAEGEAARSMMPVGAEFDGQGEVWRVKDQNEVGGSSTGRYEAGLEKRAEDGFYPEDKGGRFFRQFFKRDGALWMFTSVEESDKRVTRAIFEMRPRAEKTLDRPTNKPKSAGADRAIDLERLRSVDFDDWDNKTREDGQMSPAKRAGRDETGRWARATVKALKDMGWKQSTAERNGKGEKEVSFGYGMASEFDETNIRLEAPNGLRLFVSMRSPMSQGKLFTLLVQYSSDKERFLGGNKYLSEDMTPAEAADQLNKWAEGLGNTNRPTQGTSSLPGGVADGETRAEDQGAAKIMLRRARVRAGAIQDTDAYSKFLTDGRKPISEQLAQEAEQYLRDTQAQAEEAAKALDEETSPEGAEMLEASEAEEARKQEAARNREAPTVFREFGFTPDQSASYLRLSQPIENGTRVYRVRHIYDSATGEYRWHPSRSTVFNNGITNPPNKTFGPFAKAADALAAMQADGLAKPDAQPTAAPQSKPDQQPSPTQEPAPQGQSAGDILDAAFANVFGSNADQEPEAVTDVTNVTPAVTDVTPEPTPDQFEGDETEARRQGRADFARDMPRRLPSYIDPTDAAAADGWYRGWDEANLSQETPGVMPERPMADLPEQDPATAWDSASDAEREGVFTMGGWTLKGSFELNEAAKRNVQRDWSDLTQAAKNKVKDAIDGGMLLGEYANAERVRRNNPQTPPRPTSTPSPTPPRSAGEAAQSAASNAAEGVNDILDGIIELFGGKDQINSGLTFNAETYAKAKPMFVSGVRAFGRAGQDIIEIATALVRALQARNMTQAQLENMRPYLERFIDDVRSGKIDPFAETAQDDTVAPSDTENPNDTQISPIRQDPAQPSENVAPEGTRPDGEGADTEPGGANASDADSGGGSGASGAGVSGTRGPRNRPRPTVSEAGELGPEIQQSVDQSEAPIANFTITPELRLGQGGPTEKFNDNMAAITVLKEIEAENRRATPAEQAILARYVGWGGLKNAFRPAGSDKIAKGWESKVTQVEALLTPDELRAARASTRAAHYTSQTVVNGVWKLAQRLGFAGGAVLEPSAGTGNFLGLMPEELRANSKVMAVEYDGITARIAKHLYPQSTVLHSGFQDVPLPENKFALAIGNPPFGNESLFFQHLPSVNRRSIHNQFFQASLNSVEPDGIMTMVVSRYLMDARDPRNRIELARMGKLEAAMRLPSSAFQENARTEVVTDILAFRKHTAEPVIVEHALQVALGTPESSPLSVKEQVENEADIERLAENFRSWLNVTEFSDPAGSNETLAMNEYYHRNRAMVLGEISATGTMRRSNELNVTLPASELEARIDRAVERVQQVPRSQTQKARTLASFDALSEAMSLVVRGAEAGAVRVDEDGRLIVVNEQIDEAGNGTLRELELTANTPFNTDYYLGDDGKWRREVDQLDEGGNKVKQRKADGTLSTRNVKETQVIEDPADIPSQSKWGAKRIEMMRDMLPIRDAFRKQVSLESQFDATEAQVNANRAALKAAYDAFVGKHGPLHEPKTRAVTDTMPDGGLILAVEDVTSRRGQKLKTKPADILSKRVLMPPEKVTSAETLSDAITVSLTETGGLDLERIAGLLDQTIEDVEAGLSAGENPRGFYDPELSKWVTADEYLSGEVRRKLAAAESAGLQGNIDALSKVAPEPWGAGDITPSLGANWIPTKVYGDFLKHLGFVDAGAVYSKLTNTYTLRATGNAKEQWKTQEDRAWSTEKIVEAVMNSSGIRITYTVEVDGSDRTYVDEEATRESQEKAEELQTEFQDWVFSDDARTNQLVQIFNNRFNTRVPRQRDGSHLTLPGSNPAVDMRRHQNNAIWRGITDNVVLYDHVVGAGKTYAAIARIMERRRMGLTRKPLVVVPNHLIEQWGADWQKLYPGAKLLVASKDDMAQKNRRRLFARVASGDYDGIIIGHSQIGMIPIDRSIELGYLDEELRMALEAVDEAQEAAAEEGFSGWRTPPNVAEAERLVTKIEARIAKLRARNQDRLINFQQMGIDDITVDEAHEFKNLNYSSRLTGTAGMGNKTGSGKALDLHLKLRAMHDSGNSIAFLTGTPISNSAAEMYLVLRNLAPKQLQEMGLMNFDAWRTMFVTARAEYEPTEAGSIKQVTRLGREWTNMRTLMDLYYSVSDAVTLDDLKEDHSRDNRGEAFPVPKVLNVKEGETRLLKTIKPGPNSRRILDEIVSGFDGLASISDPKERNGERLRLMDRARKIALDPRAVDPTNPPDASGGKIKAIVEEVSRIYRKWDDDKGTQIIFLDRSVPKGKGDAKIVAAYDAAVAKYEDALNSGDDTKIGQAVDALAKFDVQDVEARRIAVTGGWNAYDEMKQQLVAEGIPEAEIAFVQDADNDDQKAILFEKVNRGEVRVLLGSTPRMGAGTNVQERLVALHHADVTWKPSDIEQREGRIIRQQNGLLAKYGQDNFGVEIIAYATERTVDAKMWDLNGQKLKSINGIRKYDGSFFMEFEDADSASMAEMAAIATGNPLMVERIKLEDQQKKLVGKLRRFNRAKNGHRSNLAKAERIIAEGDGKTDFLSRLKSEVEKQQAIVAENTAARAVTIAGTPFSDMAEATTALDDAITAQREAGNKRWRVEVGGTEVTNQEDAQTLIRRNLGTPGFMATVGGRSYIDIHAAAGALAEAYNSARAGQEGLTVKSFNKAEINGFPFEIAVSHDNLTRRMQAEAALLFDGEGAFVRFTSLDNDLVSTAQFRAILEAFSQQATPERVQMALENETSRIEEAKKAKPELEKLLEQGFPEEQQLSEVDERLDLVIDALESGLTSMPSKDAPSNKDADEMRLDDDGNPNLRASRAKPQAKRADFDAAAGDTITSAPEARKAMRKVRRALRDELAKFGIGTRITLDVREGVIDTFPGVGPMDGYFLDGVIGIAADTPGGYMGVLRHEVIHALRNPQLWGNDHGLFTASEWRTLVRAARQNTRLMDQVDADYEGLSVTDKIEEVVAEMFREWMETRDTQTALGRAFDKLRQILDAIVTALRGEGLNDAAAVFDRIRSGEIGGRGPDGPGRGADVTPVKAKIATPRDAGRISVQARNMRSGLSQLASDAVTNAMKDRGGYNTLALVPGRALFRELGKGIPAAQRYLRLKEKMDTKRNDKHSETDVVAQKWRKLANQGPKLNAEMMKIMHDATIAGTDPAESFAPIATSRDPLIIAEGKRANPVAYEAAKARLEQDRKRKAAYDELVPRFRALPRAFRELYMAVRDTYRKLDDEQAEAILGNVERAMTLAIRRAEREHRKAVRIAEENHAGTLRTINRDSSLTGTQKATRRAQADMKRDEAIKEADDALAKAKATRAWSKDSQVRKLRAQFESNRVSGPYFPLARFGEYFVLARDDEGNVQSFSRHETVQQQRAAQKDMEEEGFKVQIGVMQETDARDLVDPAFVADIERMLEEVNADEKLMDDIWQRWLQSLPDMSIRKHRIHRKNREGYDADALRAFGHHMFHGSHQLARLMYSLEMQEELDIASEEAAESDNPVRKGFVVNEMKRRHGFTMNPKGAWWASRATSLAFVYYLSVSPAAAIVNLSQTSIVGTSVLGRYGGTKKAAGALTKALADFTRSPRWHSERNTKNLSADERAAMHEAYKRGVIDRTQSHDLAQVAESGVEYNAKWVNVMGKISWLFHHSERMNREVTFLAGYRLLREQGKSHADAITQAGDATWEVHFDYQNTSKPRVMQSPGMQVLLTFRNFTVNFLWRIFRDLHQSVNGADAETRKEARRQAAVMATMMLFHAGIKGIYGYGLVMGLLGMFMPGEDDPEESLEKIMFDYLPRPVVKAMLDGVPGTLAGIDLTSRIGMPNLWFRSPLRPLEGADLYQHYVNEVLGPIPAIGMNIATGTSRVIDGAALRDGSLIWRGVETAMPKAVRDVMKGGRYAYEGALTYNGDPIKGDFSAWEIMAQVSGFTPKELADQYDQNGRLKNKERAITERRKNVIKQAAEQIKSGDPITERQLRLIDAFNRDYPEWPITMQTITRSVQGRIQRAERNEAGVSVNPRLEPRLRSSLSPLVADG